MEFDTVRSAEEALLTSEVRRDPERMRRLLHPDFVEIGRSGHRWTRDSIIAALAGEANRVPTATDEWSYTAIAPNLVMVHYVIRGTGNDSRHSSLWDVSTGSPVLRFHQGTIIPTPALTPAPVSTAAEPEKLVAEAYARRAEEYSARFGTIRSTHPADRHLVSAWAAGIDGPVIDAGCGPGQWTSFLAESGVVVRGVDLVPEFVARAERSYPQLRFEVGNLNALDVETESIAGVFAWFSLIHHDSDAIALALREFRRVLRADGVLLVGYFEGPRHEQFDHAVTPAFRWPVEELSAQLSSAGFDVIETHTRAVTGQRPVAATSAKVHPKS